MLTGAMDTLIVGDPSDPRTDVGPVIDQPSYDKLMGRREAMKDRIVKTIPAPAEGLFVPPTIIRLDAIEDLTEEWFGPLLHVTTWEGGKLAETVRRVNASGFGLTMGLHSRIARAAETVEETGTVGNLYVNRSMIGAIVGSPAVRRRGAERHRPQGRRPALSAALLRRAGDQHRHDQRRRQRVACSAWRMSASRSYSVATNVPVTWAIGSSGSPWWATPRTKPTRLLRP